MLHGLFDLLWPRLCPICDRELAPEPSGAGVHDRCLYSLTPALGTGRARWAVRACWEDSPGWFALLHAWKYGARRRLAVDVARAMSRSGPDWPDPAVLVPVPDDPRRRLARGFSPVLDLALALGRERGLRVERGLLRRRVAGSSQTTCRDDAARWANVRGAFATGDLARIDPRVWLILVDDQITSGATTRAAVGLLAARGHRGSVWCAARARRAPAGLA